MKINEVIIQFHIKSEIINSVRAKIKFPDLDRKLEMIEQIEKGRDDIPEGYTLAVLYLFEAEMINLNKI